MTVSATLDLAEASRRTWQVVVVGAGPAGALAARQAARLGLSVLLVDRAAFPRWKVCGCCLSARALETLAGVGLGELPRRCAAVPLGSVLVAARGCEARLTLPGGAALSRERFDAALVDSAVTAGAHFLPLTIAALGPAASDVREVSLAQRGWLVTARAKVVLAADGLGGRLLAGAGCVAEGSRVGAGAVAPDGPDEYGRGCVSLACGAAGYVGLVRLEDGRLDVAAALDREAVRRAGGPGPVADDLLREFGWPAVPGLGWRGTPGLIASGLRPWLVGWLGDNGLSLGDVTSWAVHPGGPRIVGAVEEALGLGPEASAASREVLAACGNMSSATLLFILERLRAHQAPRPCVALGFGPGLAAEAALLL
jgi:hypothetical protein